MDELLLLVLIMFLHLGVPKESDPCKLYFKARDESKGYRFDLNSFKGIHIITLGNEELWGGRNASGRPSGKMQLLLNLCGTLVNNDICNTTGSSCIFNSADLHHIHHVNYEETIVVKAGADDFLEFDMLGSTCKNDNNMPYTVHFHFHCDPSIANPRIIGNWNGFLGCESHVYWMTGQLCGRVDVDYPCAVDIEHGLSVDLNPLKSETYRSISDPLTNKTYQLNICGPIKKGKCVGNLAGAAHFCEIDQKSNKSLILGDAMYPYFNRQLGIVLCFSKRDRGRCKAEVLLQCVPDNNDFNQPTLSLKVNDVKKRTKLFVLETPIGCMVPPSPCVAVNEQTGEQYNLYALAGQILDFEYGATKIIVSVCGIIHKEYNKSIPCSGPGYAACHIRNDNLIRIMGMQGQAPEVTSDGTIRIVYPDGDLCPFGNNPRQRYKTYLDLHCDKSLISNEINETGCDLKIKYATPAACPSRDLLGKNCLVQDPQLNISLNLKSLRNESKDISLRNPAIRLNLCGPLLEPCNGISNTSVCVYRNGTGFPVGGPAMFPNYNDAMVRFEVYGPPCELGVNFTKVTLLLSCDHTAISLRLSPIQYESCNFYLVGKTNMTCPSFSDPFRCNVQDSKYGEWFDLSKLSDEYKIKFNLPFGNESRDVDLIFHICGSILSTSSSPCPPKSEVCILIPPERNFGTDHVPVEGGRYISLGRGDRAPYFDEDGVLKWILGHGDACEAYGYEKLFYSTTIAFICDRQVSREDSKPKFIQDISPCHFFFEWRVDVACSTMRKSEHEINEELACKPWNTLNNHSFDLSKVQKEVFKLTVPPYDGSRNKSLNFYFSLCHQLSELNFHYCGYNAGVCMEENDMTMYRLGTYPEGVRHSGHQLILKYGNGTLCANDKRQFYQAEMSFICQNEFFPREGPQFVGSLGCAYWFTFFTSYACDRDLMCAPIHGEGVDLTSLMQTTASYRVESSDGHVFLLNVCGPLPRFKRLGCKDGSAACMIQSDIRSTHVKPVSLGFPFSRPVLDHLPGNRRPQVVWKYSGGDPCPNNASSSKPSKSTASASIRFICDPGIGPGRPKYEGKASKDCIYRFSWKTSVVCIEDKVEFDRETCLLTNRGTQEKFNLSELYSDSDLQALSKGLKPGLTGENLYVYLCSWPQNWMNLNNTIECKDTAVCANIGNGIGNFSGYGYQHFAYYDSNNNTIKILFRGTYRHTCSDREVSGAEIWFPCATDKKINKPKLLAATECHVVIEWPSRLMCGLIQHQQEREMEELHKSGMRTAWKTMATLFAIAVLCSGSLYLLRKTNCWPATRSRVNRAMGYKHSTLVTYRAEPQEEWTEFETLNE